MNVNYGAVPFPPDTISDSLQLCEFAKGNPVSFKMTTVALLELKAKYNTKDVYKDSLPIDIKLDSVD